MTAVFTASSHHPFVVPEKYKNVYKDDGPNTLHKCIRYTDMSIGKFFETASKQPWFRNTIFVLTSDHTNGVDHPEFGTDLGIFSSPIIIYSPAGDIRPTPPLHCAANRHHAKRTWLLGLQQAIRGVWTRPLPYSRQRNVGGELSQRHIPICKGRLPVAV